MAVTTYAPMMLHDFWVLSIRPTIVTLFAALLTSNSTLVCSTVNLGHNKTACSALSVPSSQYPHVSSCLLPIVNRYDPYEPSPLKNCVSHLTVSSSLPYTHIRYQWPSPVTMCSGPHVLCYLCSVSSLALFLFLFSLCSAASRALSSANSSIGSIPAITSTASVDTVRYALHIRMAMVCCIFAYLARLSIQPLRTVELTRPHYTRLWVLSSVGPVLSPSVEWALLRSFPPFVPFRKYGA